MKYWFPSAHVMAANENQTITSIIFRYSIQCHCVNVSMKLVKINPNMSIENAFRRSDSMLNSRSVTPPPPPPPPPPPLDKMAAILQTIYSDAFP